MTWSTNAVTYLGGVISAHNIAQKDIGLRKQGAHLVDSRTSGSLNNTTSRPKSVSLLYGAECRRIVATDVNKLNVFHNSCLRKSCNIYWGNKFFHDDLYQETRCASIDLEVKKRRLRWLDHVLRMPQVRILKVALRWTPPGKKKRGRPKTTWRM